jgi:GNAT superfamily N-acetyltransferase
MEYLRVEMIREHMRDIPEHPLPAGFSLRMFRPGDEALWVDVQSDADRLQTIDRSIFDRNFGDDIESLSDRSFFLIAPDGSAAGSITAWYGAEPYGKEWGRIHWVAVRPAFQGRGLSKPMMTAAMKRLALSHERCYLTTATPRIAAIKVYLDFGFVPVADRPDAIRAWETVASVLRHPALEKFGAGA